MTFQPKGVKARWRIIYDLFHAMGENEVITYEALGNALNLHPATDRPTIATAVHQAAKVLEERDKRAIHCLTNVGYRVVTANEHLNLTRTTSLASHGQLRANGAEVNRLVEGLRRVLLTQLQEIEVLSAGQNAMEESLTRLEEGLVRLEARVNGEET